MDVSVCTRCDAVLTARLSRVACPAYARNTYGNGLLPVLMESGTYAVDPERLGRRGGGGPISTRPGRKAVGWSPACPSCPWGHPGRSSWPRVTPTAPS